MVTGYSPLNFWKRGSDRPRFLLISALRVMLKTQLIIVLSLAIYSSNLKGTIQDHPMTSKPLARSIQQATLADQLVNDQLWKNNLPSFKDQIRRQSAANLWRDQPKSLDSLISLDTIPLYNDQNSEDRPAFKQKARFYSDKLIIYPVALNPRPALDQPKKCLANLTRGSFRGFISKNSGCTIRQRLEAWIKSVYTNRKHYSGQYKPKHSHITFITLTLPSKQIHSDNEIKRSVLMPFIQQIKRTNGVEQYFWAAEPQENSNLHFHLLVDRWIDKKILADRWNVATNHLGYLDRYIEATGSVNPPSTKINECPENMSLVKYVLKYVSKQPHIQYAYSSLVDQVEHPVTYWESEEIKGGYSELIARGLELGIDANDQDGQMFPNRITVKNGKVYRWYLRRPVEGRSWGMSKELSQINIFSADVSYRIRDIRSILEWDSSVKFVQKDHCEVFYCNVYDVLLKYDQTLRKQYDQHYLNVYASLYLPKPAAAPESVPIYSLSSLPPPFSRNFKQTSLLFA